MIQLGAYAFAVISAYAFTAIVLLILVLQTFVSFKANKRRLERLIKSKRLLNEES